MAEGSYNPNPAELSVTPENLGIKLADASIPKAANPASLPENQTSESIIRNDTGVEVNKSLLTAQIIEDEIIQNNGKIPYSRFMEVSLFGPDGYYSKGKAKIGQEFGEQMDFDTSPEISELFGATLGVGLARVWDAMGKPAKFDLVEMGAGHGSLAHGLLKWIKELRPDFYQAVKYTIVEYGKELINKQRERNVNTRDKINWIQGSAYQLPLREVEGAIISNELVDAFPIERVKLINGEVKQLYISIEGNQWVEVWDEPSADVVQYVTDNLYLKEDIEEPINLNAVKLQKETDRALKRGVILTIDYGDQGHIGQEDKLPIRVYGANVNDAEDTLTQYRTPGDVDITANVNFGVLEYVAKKDGLQVVFSARQANLLRRFGFHEVVDQAYNRWLTMSRSFAELRLSYLGLDTTALQKLVSTPSSLAAGVGHYYSHILSKNLDLAQTQIFVPEPTFDQEKDGQVKTLSLADGNLTFAERDWLDDRYQSSIGRILEGIPINVGLPLSYVAIVPTEHYKYPATADFPQELLEKMKNAEVLAEDITPGTKLPDSLLQPTRREGVAYINPTRFRNQVILDKDGNILFDLRKEEDFQKLLAQSGYTE